MKHVLFLALFLIASQIFALPGITPYLPDDSGLYVFYQDFSFKRTSFVGFLQYDEKNFAMRYYAPEVNTKKEKQSEKSVDILFTVDPSLGYVRLTGEKFLHPVSNEDVSIVNYLHDLVTELANHRKNLMQTWSANRAQTLNYSDSSDLFGSLVNLQFDCYVPIFNLRRMLDSGSKPIFELVTAGKLESNEDASFWDFAGLPQNTAASHAALSFTQKSEWEQKAQNIWALQNAAIFSVTESEIPQSMQKASFALWDYFKRFFLLSTNNSFTDWKNISIVQNTQTLQIFSYRYGDGAIYDVKILAQKKDALRIFSLAIYKSDYDKNNAYFRKIIADCVTEAAKQDFDVSNISNIINAVPMKIEPAAEQK